MEIQNKHHNIHKKFWFLPVSLIIVYSAGYGSCIYLNNKNADNIITQSKIDTSNIKKQILEIKERKKNEPVYITLQNAEKFRALVEDYNASSSVWRLVNKTNPLDVNYVPENLVTPDVALSASSHLLRSEAAVLVKSMFEAAKLSGLNLVIGSAYRSADTQQYIYNNAVASDGIENAGNSVALPGQSEHQTGLAVDITANANSCYIQNCFSTTDDGIWLAENSYKYGFILRYPKDKENITGYRYEPWHFRYVGVELATALYQSDLTLEEAWPFIEKAQTTLKQNNAL